MSPLLKVSPTQMDVLLVLREHGGVITRWPGGFWTYPDCPARGVDARGEVPTWSVTARTVRALEARGLLQVRPGPLAEWARPRQLTPAGRDSLLILLGQTG